MCPHRAGERQQGQSRAARRLRILAIVCLVLTLWIGGRWLWEYAHQYPEVARYHSTERVQVRSSGFLCTENWHQFTFRDWTGRIRWQVDTAGVNFWRTPENTPCYCSIYPFALSADSRTLAALISPDGRRMRLGIWQDGRQVSRMTLPGGISGGDLWLLKNGRIYLSASFWDGSSRVMIIDKGQVIASTPGMQLYNLSPDGSVALMGITRSSDALLAQPVVAQGKVTFTRKTTFPKQMMQMLLLNGGYIQLCPGNAFHYNRPVKALLAYEQGTDTATGEYVTSFSHSYVNVLCPRTGDQWKLALPGTYTLPGNIYAGGAQIYHARVTDDGRLVAIHYLQDKMGFIHALAARCALPTRWIPERKQFYVAIYQRPGRLVAQFTPDMRQLFNASTSLPIWYPSPDGRRLLVDVTVKGKGGDLDYEAVLMQRRF